MKVFIIVVSLILLYASCTLLMVSFLKLYYWKKIKEDNKVWDKVNQDIDKIIKELK